MDRHVQAGTRTDHREHMAPVGALDHAILHEKGSLLRSQSHHCSRCSLLRSALLHHRRTFRRHGFTRSSHGIDGHRIGDCEYDVEEHGLRTQHRQCRGRR